MSDTSYKDNEREVEERMKEMERHSDGYYKMPEE
jgi:hypothetical protein